ncbi:hypothetical protein [Kineosporia sp. R_H_3]|uniref:hypothetical protein n=1 Tax=Kineosporia sp. R_H_3 TaxID=1961848 RepID=UPI00117B9E04|nr:hypothetical protein [Kineosporia sp. R_H_3]
MSPTPASRVLRTPVRNTVGEDTADKFEWQVSVAAADACRLLREVKTRSAPLPSGDGPVIISEHHEDWAIIKGRHAELVSAKHRESSTGAWTLPELVASGGVAHLFHEWRRTGRGARCRLVSNSGLKAGPAQKVGLATHLARSQTASLSSAQTQALDLAVDQLTRQLMMNAEVAHLTPAERSSGRDRRTFSPVPALLLDVRRFMASLVFDCDRPQAKYIDSSSPADYVQPLIRVLGGDVTRAAEVWREIKSQLRPRMQGHGETPAGSLDYLSALASDDPALSLREEHIARRTIHIDGLLEVVAAMLATTPVRPIPTSIYRDRLSIKMDRGGCSPSQIAAAQHHVSAWVTASTDLVPDAPGFHPAVDKLRMKLERAALQAEIDAIDNSVQGDQYGRGVMSNLYEQVDALQTFAAPPFPLTYEVVLGGMLQHATQCRLWFGPRFTIEPDAVDGASLKPSGEGGQHDGR